MSFGKQITLNNGVKMPQIGLGTWQSAAGEVERAVEAAIKIGYKHIDAAVIYGNQNEVAEGIKRAGVPREDLFLVSKLWCNSHRPELVAKDLERTLKELNTDYLDLYLIHWPTHFMPGETMSATKKTEDGKEEVVIDTECPSIGETWKEMVKLLDTGKVKAIGVSNFTVKHFEILAKASPVVPAVNQIEAHPLLQQPELMKYCADKGIHVTAYSPLGQNITGFPPVIGHETVKSVASKLGVSPAAVLIAWGVQRGTSVIPKSVTPSRLQSNFEQIELSTEDFNTISDIIKEKGETRFNTPWLYSPRWPINVFGSEAEKDAPLKVW